MTPARVLRILRTAFGVLAAICFTTGVVFCNTGHLPGGVILLGCTAIFVTFAVTVVPRRAGPARHARPPVPTPAEHADHIDRQVAEFAAQISAWEASRRAGS